MMIHRINLREATLEDGEALLRWINDPGTRSASHNSEIISKEIHMSWLSKLLNDDNRYLFVAEEAGKPVGSVRAELSEGTYVLSWSVSPEARGLGVAKTMVSWICDRISGPKRAEVKKENVASIRVATYAGLVLGREDKGVLHFYRDTLDLPNQNNAS